MSIEIFPNEEELLWINDSASIIETEKTRILHHHPESEYNVTFNENIHRCGNMTDSYLNVWQTFQWWCEGVLFTGIGLGGLIANCFSIGILSTKDMRKHSFNQLLIALCLFDLLFIIVSIPVYSFNLFGIFMGNQVCIYYVPSVRH